MSYILESLSGNLLRPQDHEVGILIIIEALIVEVIRKGESGYKRIIILTPDVSINFVLFIFFPPSFPQKTDKDDIVELGEPLDTEGERLIIIKARTGLAEGEVKGGMATRMSWAWGGLAALLLFAQAISKMTKLK